MEGIGKDREASIETNFSYDINIDDEDSEQGVSFFEEEKPSTNNTTLGNKVYIAPPVIGNNERKNPQQPLSKAKQNISNTRPQISSGSSSKDNICPNWCIICPY